MLARILPAVFTLLLPSAAHASSGGEIFVSCPVNDGKHLEVLIQQGSFAGDGGFTYAFGPSGAPELSLSVPMSAGTVKPWPGVGRAIWSSVTFPHDDYEYEVWHSFDRLDEEAELEAGVTVLQGANVVAHLECSGGQIAPAFTLEDAMAAAGYCWNTVDSQWGRSDCE